MKKRIFQTTVIILLLASASSLYSNLRSSEIGINDNFLKAEIASTESDRAKGLSGRKDMSEDEALKMVFDEEDYHSIWMKDMNFSIDIIWVDTDREVVDIKENASPESYPEVFTPQSPAKYILEVKAGVVSENDLKIGDKLDF